jgi:UDP-GlcNAc:undecaprenyl-phosphate/decaprenyl-phosphate GlcNAc-1-phosphate transferase
VFADWNRDSTSITSWMLIQSALAFTITVAVCPILMFNLGRLQLVDTPNYRSSHDAPTPRGGGLAVAAGVIVGLAFSPAFGRWRAPLLLAPIGFGLLGLADDIWSVPPLKRLVLQAVIASATLQLLLRDMNGSGIWRLIFGCGIVLWLVSYVNAFNFMDGINGISSAQALVAGGSWWAMGVIEEVPVLAWGGTIIAASVVAFVPYNFPKARIFLGDVGSYFIGAWLAVLVVIGLRSGMPVEAVLAPIGLGLADTLWTIVRRIRSGETWHQAHRSHVYQRLVRLGWTHTVTTLTVGAIAVVCSLLGAISLARGSMVTRIVADLLIGGILVGYLMSPRFVAKRCDPQGRSS